MKQKRCTVCNRILAPDNNTGKCKFCGNTFKVALGVPGKGRETAMRAVLDASPSAKVGEGMSFGTKKSIVKKG